MENKKASYRFMELIFEMIKRLNSGSQKDKEKLNNVLFKLIGEEINPQEAYDILTNVLSSENKDTLLNKKVKFRIINPREVKNLTEEALKYLLEIQNSNISNEHSFEKVLSDLSQFSVKVDVEALKELLNYRGITQEKIIN